MKCCKKHKNVTQTQSEEMVGKMALPDEGSYQPSTCKKKKEREREKQYLQRAIKQCIVKWGVPV